MKLNCDLGEAEKILEDSIEHKVMPYIDMANIACGFHAGNTQVMRACIQLALENKVQVGAHPSYPDRENFGRTSMALNPADIADLMYQQLRTIDAIADEFETQLDYVKPHGALYNDMMLSDAVFDGVLQGVSYLDSNIPLIVMATPRNEHYQTRAKAKGINLIFEAFADRRYTDQGVLQSRLEDGSVLNESELILKQAQLIKAGQVETVSGKLLNIEADSLCVHGDNETSVSIVKELKAVLS